MRQGNRTPKTIPSSAENLERSNPEASAGGGKATPNGNVGGGGGGGGDYNISKELFILGI